MRAEQLKVGDYVLAWGTPWRIESLSPRGRIAFCVAPYWREYRVPMRFPVGWLKSHQHCWLGEIDSSGDRVWSAA